MLALVADLDPFAAGADEVLERGVQVQRIAHLIKIGHLQLGATAYFAAVRFEFAQDELEQGGLARAVGAQQADLVASQQGAGELVDDGAHAAVGLREAFAHVGQFGHQLATGHARGDFHLHIAHLFTAGGAFTAQVLQAGDPALAARAARFYAFANPDFFLGQQFIGFSLNHGFLCQLLFFLNLVGRIVARVWAQFASVQFNDAGRNPVQKGAVMGDGNDAALEVNQQVFEPSDGIQVEVVGGFVQQENVGPCDQSLRQCHSLSHAARQRLNNRIGVEFQTLQGFFQSLLPAPTIS